MKKTIAIFLAWIVLVSLCGCGSTAAEKTDSSKVDVSARKALDGAAYLVTEGECYSFASGLGEGYATPDRAHVITLTEDGALSYSDAKMENAIEVSSSASSVSDVRNDGFFYTSKDNISYRVRFSTGESEKLGEDVRFTVAKNTTSVLYATGEGKIFTLACDASEPVKAGTFDDRVSVCEISDDAGIAVWLLNDGSQYTPVILTGDEKKTGESYTSRYSGFGAEFSKDQKLVVLGSYYSSSIYIAEEGKGTVKVTLPDDLYYPIFYSENGRVRETNAADISAVFVHVDAKSGASFYSIARDGEEKERLLANIAGARVKNGKAIYWDEDDNLFLAPLSASGLGEETKISGGIDRFTIAQNGKYIYFTKNADDGTATLCAYSVADGAVQKITGDCSGSTLYVSTDGATVFYFKNTEAIDSNSSYGDLYSWTYSKKETESTKIASDVLTNSLTSFLTSGELDKTRFVFERFNTTMQIDGSSRISYDLLRFNGKETEKVQSELLK